MICAKCGSANVERTWEPCAVATESMRHEDYYGDGSVFAPVGVHYDAYQCADCGDSDAEPCIHD